MEIAAQAHRQRVAHELLQMRDHSLQISPVVVIAVVGMRSRYLVRDAVGRSHPAHGDGHLPGFRSIVYFRKNVRVNIDHGCKNTSGPAGLRLI